MACSKTCFVGILLIGFMPLIFAGFSLENADFSALKWRYFSAEGHAEMKSMCSVSRSMGKSGFHRQLTSEIRFTVPYFVWERQDGEAAGEEQRQSRAPKISAADCEILLVESLPAGLYVDLYQAEQWQANGGPQVCSSSDIDLEKPEYESLPHELFVYSRVRGAPDLLDDKGNSAFHVFTVNVSIDVHARYHLASYENGYASIQIPPPKIFFYFNNAGLDQLTCSKKQKPTLEPDLDERVKAAAACTRDERSNCSWFEIYSSHPDDASKPPPSVEFEVPVGRMEDLMLVTVATFTLTTAVALWLAITIIKIVVPHR